MTDVSEWLLTALLNHGNALLGGTLFLAAFGVPLPATMTLMAAGAFTRQGVLPIESAVLSACLGAMAGDACSYLFGRAGLKRVPRRITGSQVWQRAAALFAVWGGWGVFVSRFLLTPVALPVNLLAGATGYPWPRFLLAVVAGEAIWVVLYGGLGHLFADQWENLGRLAGDAVGVLMGAVLLGSGIRALMAGRRRRTDARR
ncbi:DedA family protein [Hydrogenophaga sp.]|uniref:DedA family protein n=1 Tax=Hydrogenophaga sp. TaxID=1904254 RepID=UPI003D0EA122